MSVDPSMTQSICQEMCESVLLYLGNNLYGVLRWRPFTLERPVQCILDDTQKMRPLYVDINTSLMYLEVRKDSSYEKVIQEEEIEIPEEQKPELLLDVPTLSILDPDFVPDFLPIKDEPEWDQTVVGHLITQPGPIAKEIKQELQKGLSGIRIEDVRSLLDVDEQSKLMPPDPEREGMDDTETAKPESEKTPKLRWSRVLHKSVPIEEEHESETLNVVTEHSSASTIVVSSDPVPLNVVTPASPTQTTTVTTVTTASGSSLVPLMQSTPRGTSTANISTTGRHLSKPTLMVIKCTSSTALVCSSAAPSPNTSLSVVTPGGRPESATVTPSDPLFVVTSTTLSKGSIASIRPLRPLSMVTASPTEPGGSTEPVQSSSPKPSAIDLPASFRYYDVLTLDEDDIVSISYQELMERRCNVTLDRLDDLDITDIKQSLRPQSYHAVEPSASTTSDTDVEIPVKKRKRVTVLCDSHLKVTLQHRKKSHPEIDR